MNMEFYRKLPTPKELKEEFPASDKIQKIKAERDAKIRAIFEGKNDKLLLVIGPCSADREDAVLEYIGRLVKVQEKVKTAIENMTGLTVTDVNIRIAGVNMSAGKH